MLLFAILAVFIAGLMVGRTPEYLGKKIEAKEVKMAMLAILILPLSILGFTALATVLPAGLAGPRIQGPHGFSEILYAYTSGTGNNGSAFAGLSANTPFYNTTIGVRDADRPVLHDRADAGGRGLAGREEDRAGVGRHLPDRPAAVCRIAGRRDPDRRRPDLLPGTRARPDRRALRDASRHALLIENRKPQHTPHRGTLMTTMEITPHLRKRMPVATMTDPAILVPAIGQAFRKLDPRLMVRNPVMFAVEIVAALTTLLFLRDLRRPAPAATAFSFQINLWLWFTVLFANFAEAVAEGRGKAQAATLRRSKTETMAKLLSGPSREWQQVAGDRR